ncbi:pentapeptide repeat-containing protein [Nostoc sp. T09]|uniref:pentapeptide repeat-containing protein n=1 Tax=Nostoc sp. T09 TaxID=1932621 RepID=UPI001C4E3AC9|nr:pentapeptide repeat-containing protein [Nostoc sp. T09]
MSKIADYDIQSKVDKSDNATRCEAANLDAKEILNLYAASKRNFRQADLRKISLIKANFREVNFTGSNLNNSNLGSANLNWLNLRRKNITGLI